MRWVAIALGSLLSAVSPLYGQAPSPHQMLKPDGEIDIEKCWFCHEEDMSLSRSKRETCTLCHAETTHGGSAEHLHTTPARVIALLGPVGDEKPYFRRAEDGGIFCGTCHLFHDPAVGSEPLLAQGWLPPSTGLSAAVRESLQKQWGQIAQKYGEESGPVAQFATTGTKQLRMPVDEGGLCRHCHGDLK